MDTEARTSATPSDPVFEVFVAIQNHQEHRRGSLGALGAELARILCATSEKTAARAAAKQLVRIDDGYGRYSNLGWETLWHMGHHLTEEGEECDVPDAVRAAVRVYPAGSEVLAEAFSETVRSGRIELQHPHHRGGDARYLGETVMFVEDLEVLAETMESIHRLGLTERGKVLVRYAELAEPEAVVEVVEERSHLFADPAVFAVMARLPLENRIALGTAASRSYTFRRAALVTLPDEELEKLSVAVGRDLKADVSWAVWARAQKR